MGRIFLVTPKRLKTEKEIKESITSSIKSKVNNESYFNKPKKITENTDYLKLLVFNPSGKVVAGAQLNVDCDKIYVHNDRLFLINSLFTQKVYEYKMTFR
jgi:hypothetical protein